MSLLRISKQKLAQVLEQTSYPEACAIKSALMNEATRAVAKTKRLNH